MNKPHDDVLKFIEKFHDNRDVFLYGQCYYFALILRRRFKSFYAANIVYNQIENHFACRIDGIVYDVTGVINGGDWEYWSMYRIAEPLDAARVYRDCIWQIDPEEWNLLDEDLRKHPWQYE